MLRRILLLLYKTKPAGRWSVGRTAVPMCSVFDPRQRNDKYALSRATAAVDDTFYHTTHEQQQRQHQHDVDFVYEVHVRAEDCSAAVPVPAPVPPSLCGGGDEGSKVEGRWEPSRNSSGQCTKRG